ncbi:hypothetical protein ACPXB3_02605 [Gordonia sp. DT219]|uniref:hypothetical protein n=1 Tax=Gordonia sp. DT219 TaxID=3416658 RepID=UPI003CEC664F
MTSTDHVLTRAWPTCAFGAWSAAWIAGRCSPDDVADTLADSADLHVLDDRSGTDVSSAHGVLGLLGMLRGARRLSVRLPSAGAPHGLPPDDATTAAFAAGEVLLIDDGAPTPLALIPGEHDGSLRWRALRYGTSVPSSATAAAGQIELELRQAITTTADLITRIGGRTATAPADLRATLRAETHRHLVDLPPHDDQRATRMIETAAQVESIASLAAGAGAGFGTTADQWSAGDSELRRLVTLARSARAAAVDRVIGEFLGVTW